MFSVLGHKGPAPNQEEHIMARKQTTTTTTDAPALAADTLATATETIRAGLKSLAASVLEAARIIRAALPDGADYSEHVRDAFAAADADNRIAKSTRNHYVNAARIILDAGKGNDTTAPDAMSTIVNAIAKDGLTRDKHDAAVKSLTRAKVASKGAATIRSNARKEKEAKRTAEPTPEPTEPNLTPTPETMQEDRTKGLTDTINALITRINNTSLTTTDRAHLAARVQVLAETVASARTAKPAVAA